MGYNQSNPTQADFVWEYFHITGRDTPNQTRIIDIKKFEEFRQIYNEIPPRFALETSNQHNLRNPLGLKHKLYWILWTYYKKNAHLTGVRHLNDFCPVSFNLEYQADYQRFLQSYRQNPYKIYLKKAVHLGVGRGINLLSNEQIEEIIDPSTKRQFNPTSPIKVPISNQFIQELIDQDHPPLLFSSDGKIFRKFYLKCYVLIASVKPLIVYKFNQYNLFASFKEYKPSVLNTVITNIRLPDKDCDVRPIEKNRKYPFGSEHQYHFNLPKDFRSDQVYSIIDQQANQIIINVIKAGYPHFLKKFGLHQFFGFDLQVEQSNLNVWLLEVNEQVGLDFQDKRMVKQMLEESLEITDTIFNLFVNQELLLKKMTQSNHDPDHYDDYLVPKRFGFQLLYDQVNYIDQYHTRYKFFEPFLQKNYQLKPYCNNQTPTLIYAPKADHLPSLIKNQEQKLIIWCGGEARTDRPANRQLIAAIKQLTNVNHISVSTWVNQDLEHFGLKYRFVPIAPTIDPTQIQPIKKGPSVYIYSSIDPISREHYGYSLYQQVIKHYKGQLNFILATNPIHYQQYGKTNFGQKFICYKTFSELRDYVYSECFIGLRLTDHDGNSATVQELGFLGIKSIHNGYQPCAVNYQSIEDIIQIIDRERQEIGKTDDDLHRRMQFYYRMQHPKLWLNRHIYQ